MKEKITMTINQELILDQPVRLNYNDDFDVVITLKEKSLGRNLINLVNEKKTEKEEEENEKGGGIKPQLKPKRKLK